LSLDSAAFSCDGDRDLDGEWCDLFEPALLDLFDSTDFDLLEAGLPDLERDRDLDPDLLLATLPDLDLDLLLAGLADLDLDFFEPALLDRDLRDPAGDSDLFDPDLWEAAPDLWDPADPDLFDSPLWEPLERLEATLLDLDFLERFVLPDLCDAPDLLDSAEGDRDRALDAGVPEREREVRLPARSGLASWDLVYCGELEAEWSSPWPGVGAGPWVIGLTLLFDSLSDSDLEDMILIVVFNFFVFYRKHNLKNKFKCQTFLI
jgi:hypothetical protein